MSQMVITQIVSLSDDGVTALHRAREGFISVTDPATKERNGRI